MVGRSDTRYGQPSYARFHSVFERGTEVRLERRGLARVVQLRRGMVRRYDDATGPFEPLAVDGRDPLVGVQQLPGRGRAERDDDHRRDAFEFLAYWGHATTGE